MHRQIICTEILNQNVFNIFVVRDVQKLSLQILGLFRELGHCAKVVLAELAIFLLEVIGAVLFSLVIACELSDMLSQRLYFFLAGVIRLDC